MFLSAALLLFLAQQPEQPPTFKAGVNFVEVDVVVTDKAGRPVRGLRQEDFEVFEDGRRVAVATFVPVDIAPAPPDAVVPRADRSGASIGSNDQREDGRVILIVLDDYHVRFNAGYAVKTKAIARKLVERLGPSDQAAVIATSGRSVMQAEFTGDKARLVEAIDRFFPQAELTSSGAEVQTSLDRGLGRPSSGNFGPVQEIKARWAMETLSNAAKTLAEIPHRRKTVLLVSEGLPASVEEIISNPNASAAWNALRDFILTAQRSNVVVYPVDPCGLGLDCSRAAQENLRSLAENTGGFAVVNTNAPEESVERIVAESGTYYLLGYASPAPANDGRRHRIRVRTRLSDVEVRAREGYISPRRANRSPSAEAPADLLIGAPIQTRGLNMRVAAVPTPLGSSDSTVVVAIELPAKEAVAAGRIDFTVVAIDASSGKIRTQQRFSNSFESRGSEPAGWTRLRSHFPVPAGRYQLRVAAVGANHQQGSVFTEVDVPEFNGELAVGGLSLAAPTPGADVAAKHMAGVPPLMPLASRDVPINTSVAAQVPVRVAPKARSSPATVTATLVKPDGGTISLETNAATSDQSGRVTQVYRIALPSGLAAGSYRVAVDAALGRERITREIAFRVVP